MKDKINIPWLEIPLSEHCNLKCKGCTHHSPYLSPCFYDLDQYSKDINTLKDIIHTKILIFLGGEPLLNKDINEYIKMAKESKIADVLRVTTNGLLLMKMNNDFFDLVDEIKVSLYPNINIDKKELEEFLIKKSSIHNFNYSIREFDTFLNIETDKLSDEDALKNYNKCERKKNGHLVYNGYYYKCMRPVSTKQFLQVMNSETNIPDFRVEDGVRLESENIKENLKNYIVCQNNLLSCHYCLLGFSEKSIIDKAKSILVNSNFLVKLAYNSGGVYKVLKSVEKVFKKNKTNEKTCECVVESFEHNQLRVNDYKFKK